MMAESTRILEKYNGNNKGAKINGSTYKGKPKGEF